MFDSFNHLLRTLVIGVLVLLAGWWTLFLRSKIGEHEEAIADRDGQIETLAQDLAHKDGEIKNLGEELSARDRRIEELAEEVALLGQEVRILEASLLLLKVDHRLAHVEVLEQSPADTDPKLVRTLVRFTEVDAQGAPIAPSLEAEIEGKILYVETLVIKFGDEFVEGGDSLRGSSVCLFRRLFGEDQSPTEGVAIDTAGTRPAIYGGDTLPDPLYQELWSSFWDYANDPELARARGVRAIHGEAPFIELRPGRSYRIELRASDGLTILAED